MNSRKSHKMIFIFLLIAIAIILPARIIWAEELSAEQILAKVDKCLNAPQDQTIRMKLIIIDKTGKEAVREIMIMQKGSDKRIGKFLSPADQKGIGFLSLPNNVFYVYLPAYKKTRRIASHIKNSKFAGTDFTYEDMEAKKYTDNWLPKLISQDREIYQLELLPKKGVVTDYGKLILSVRTDNFYPQQIEYYDKTGKLIKKMISERIEQVDKFWVAKETTMEDFKSGRKTKMILEDVKFNSGIADNVFTERYLAQ
ncbi:MAG: outer membrane lipoprotein-sorting protein [candidate division WOR-3 bacterium]